MAAPRMGPTVWRTVKTPAKAGDRITADEAEQVAKAVKATKERKKASRRVGES